MVEAQEQTPEQVAAQAPGVPRKITHNEIVKYQNKLNNVSLRRFNATDMNIFFSVVSRVRDKESDQIVLSYSYLKKLSKYNKHDDFTKYLKRLTSKLQNISIESDDGNIYRTLVLFTEFEANREKQTLTVSVNPKTTYFFNELNREFTRFSLNQYTNFASSYSKTAFRLIKQYRTIGKRQFSVEDFRRLLDIPKSYRISDIDRRVIKMIKEEVSPVIPGLEISKIKRNGKRGKKVVGYSFTWKPEPAKSDDFILNSALEQITAINNVKMNPSLTEKERNRAIDRIKGLELGTTEARKELAIWNARSIDAEEVDKQSDNKKLSKTATNRRIKALEKKKKLSDKEQLELANLKLHQRRQELGYE